jgi:hypothetical protein
VILIDEVGELGYLPLAAGKVEPGRLLSHAAIESRRRRGAAVRPANRSRR